MLRDGICQDRPQRRGVFAHGQGEIGRIQVNVLTGSRKYTDFDHDVAGMVQVEFEHLFCLLGRE
jgi:hypothetical protein